MKKTWKRNGLYLIIALTAFSLSLFKWDNQVWIAAWIAPIFFMRFMRNSRWVPAVIWGFVVLQLAVVIGMLPIFASVDMDGSAGTMDPLLMIAGSAKAGTLFLAPLFMIPFILDKALHKHLPNFAAHLVFPSAFVAIELLYSYSVGTLFSLGQSQFSLQSLAMATSIFGLYGLTFLIAWFAPIIIHLWEEDWDIKKIGTSGLVYICVLGFIVIYGAIAIVFPKKAENVVPIAGIVLEANFQERVMATGYNFLDPNVNPTEYSNQLSSPASHLQEVRHKTQEAIDAGAEIIVWQELALTLEASLADVVLLEMKNLADENNVYLLVSYGRILSEKEKQEKIIKNLSILFTPDGEIGWEYEKAYPVPGAEDLAVQAGIKNIPYFDTSYGRIGLAICFDMHFPQYLRQAAQKDIDILFSPAYDGSAYTPLHAFNGGFRAIENGFTLIRVTGDGYSAVIDPYYRLWFAKNTFEQGTNNFYYDVPVISKNTVYATIGFITPYVSVLLLTFLLAASILNASKKKSGSV